VLVAVVGADLWSVLRHYWMFLPPARVTYATDPAIEYMRRSAQPGRVIPIMASGEGIVQERDGALNYDDMMVHRVRMPAGYHGNELGRYRELCGGQRCEQVLNPAFWRLTNVRWLYTNASQLDTALKRVVGPVKNAAGNTVYLYETPGSNPYAWVAAVAVKTSDDGLPATLLDQRFDPRRVAVFDTAAPVRAANISALPEPAATEVTVASYAPGRVVLDLAQPAQPGQALVVSENYYPGWTARVDGRPAPVGRADYVLTGVELPAGARRVELSFSDPRYTTGKSITLVAMLLVVAAIGAGLAIDRRTARV